MPYFAERNTLKDPPQIRVGAQRSGPRFFLARAASSALRLPGAEGPPEGRESERSPHPACEIAEPTIHIGVRLNRLSAPLSCFGGGVEEHTLAGLRVLRAHNVRLLPRPGLAGDTA